MPPVGFEPTISAGERPQAYALDRSATGTGRCFTNKKLIKFFIWNLIGLHRILPKTEKIAQNSKGRSVDTQLHVVDQQILGMAITHLVAIATWRPGFVKPWFNYFCKLILCLQSSNFFYLLCNVSSVDVNSDEMTYSQLMFLEPLGEKYHNRVHYSTYLRLICPAYLGMHCIKVHAVRKEWRAHVCFPHCSISGGL